LPGAGNIGVAYKWQGGRYTAAKQILDVTDWDRFLSFYSLILASLIG
jgi:hypothetical protein